MLENKLKWYSAVATAAVTNSNLMAYSTAVNVDPDALEHHETIEIS